MKLSQSKLCLDCEEVFETKQSCPRCGSGVWSYLTEFVPCVTCEVKPITNKMIDNVVGMQDFSLNNLYGNKKCATEIKWQKELTNK